ncbi:MAG: hypothetical protein R3F55_22575 [Alphaproteobacteria bacterium]
MRTTVIALLLLAGAGPAFAAGDLHCRYASSGILTGADSNGAGLPPGQITQSGDASVFVIAQGQFHDANDCPDSLADAQAMAGGQPTGGGGGGQQAGGGAGATPDVSMEPTFGSVSLAAGFEPDPHEVMLAAGGPLDTGAALLDCVAGMIAEAPDYRLQYTAGQYRLTFSVHSDADTTLVVNDPQGNWVCNDDANGVDPQLQFDPPASGQYDIWVGAWGDITPDATLTITER